MDFENVFVFNEIAHDYKNRKIFNETIQFIYYGHSC